jgi:protein dithiol:quinone oxidoreductase
VPLGVVEAAANARRPTRRLLNLAGLAACAAMMGFALYAQHGLHLEPCNMCILQRIGVVALGIAFLLAALHDPRAVGARLYALLIGLCAVATAGVAGRHVWVQAQPAGSLPSCGADFYSLLDMMPVHEAVIRVLKGGGDCQAISWWLWGLSMPVWVLIAVVVVGGAGVLGNLALARER